MASWVNFGDDVSVSSGIQERAKFQLALRTGAAGSTSFLSPGARQAAEKAMRRGARLNAPLRILVDRRDGRGAFFSKALFMSIRIVFSSSTPPRAAPRSLR